MTAARRAGPYRGKRLVDLAIALPATPPALLVGLVCALAVKLTSRGPVLFRQARVGRDGVDFEVLKFRSMTVGDNPLIPDEDRITRVGRVLRRGSLDELPQLWHVLTGEMSIVGPRPTLRYQVDRYDERQRRRLAVRPGLTGLAQIRGRNLLRWSDRIEHDLEYVRDQSPWLDLRIVAATFRPLLTGEGVEGHPEDDELVTVSPTGDEATVPGSASAGPANTGRSGPTPADGPGTRDLAT